MGIVKSALGAVLSPLLIKHSLWAVKLDNGKFLSERDEVVDAAHGTKRPFDWTLDLIDKGDIHRVRELWLFCPPSKASPLGNTARLPILESGTAFQFKVASLSGFFDLEKCVESHVIGRVDNKETGDCTCFIWDGPLQVMSQPWKSNIYHFGSWREGIAPIGALSQEVMGLRLA